MANVVLRHHSPCVVIIISLHFFPYHINTAILSISLFRYYRSTVISILSNEKYKGDALLQKTYTVDFLDKTVRKNEGKLPQYYIENSHPAIIAPEIFD